MNHVLGSVNAHTPMTIGILKPSLVLGPKGPRETRVAGLTGYMREKRTTTVVSEEVYNERSELVCVICEERHSFLQPPRDG